MEREQYAVMARREDHHWWYTGMRRVALSVLDQALAGRSGLLVLDAGCGTGGTTARLTRYGRVIGVDLALEALQPAAARGLQGRLVRGTVERLPFPSATFDAATSFEVVYHLGVANDDLALAELRRVLKPGGLLLLRVPAHDWLRGAHDRLVHTRHRYAPDELRAKLARAGFRVDHLSWANSLLFPPAVAKRLLERVSLRQAAAGAARAASMWPPSSAEQRVAEGGEPSSKRSDDSLVEATAKATATVIAESGVEPGAEPDLWQPPQPLNVALESLVAVEAVLVPRGLGLPFGLSLLAVARAT